MALPELLQWLQMSQKTGTLIFERRGVVKKVFVENGLIISASSNDPREYLGQILICFGSLDEEGLEEAFKLQKEKNKLLGKILVENFSLTEEVVLKSIRIKIEETIYNIFLWDTGKFVYTEGITGLMQHNRLETAIQIDQVLFEGARRVDEWREFRKEFPRDDMIFAYKGGKREIKDFGKDPIVSKIYEQIDGKKSIQRILLDTHAPEYRGYEAFGKLYWGEYIQAVGEVEREPEKKIQDFQAELKKAADLYRSKKLADAYSILENFVASKPTDEEGQTLFAVVRESYLKYLYELCPPNSIPVLTMDFSDLNEEIFSSKEGYLASRINGEWDVKSLIMISPLGEMESLRILQRLVDGGMVKLHEAKKRSS
ncbi:MAG: DUF4388 domain-containing protein [Bradymonadales bacterium]|nr:MAG: DUF4388 domain-containing protein [Bradymonadales bacterium]